MKSFRYHGHEPIFVNDDGTMTYRNKYIEPFDYYGYLKEHHFNAPSTIVSNYYADEINRIDREILDSIIPDFSEGRDENPYKDIDIFDFDNNVEQFDNAYKKYLEKYGESYNDYLDRVNKNKQEWIDNYNQSYEKCIKERYEGK